MFELNLSEQLSGKRASSIKLTFLLIVLISLLLGLYYLLIDKQQEIHQVQSHSVQRPASLSTAKARIDSEFDATTELGSCEPLEHDYTILGVIYDQVKVVAIIKQRQLGNTFIIGLGNELSKGFRLISASLQGVLFKRDECEVYFSLSSTELQQGML